MFRETTLTIADESTSDEVRHYVTDLERHNRALKATVRLLDKCLTEAADDRDKYKGLWQDAENSRDNYHSLYLDAKTQLDKLNANFDEYIKREKIIKDAEESTKRFEKKLKSGYFDGKSESEKAADEFERLLDSGFFNNLHDTMADDVAMVAKMIDSGRTIKDYLGGKSIEQLKEEWIG